MPPRRRAAPPPIDVDDLRSRLDQGKIVRVAIAHSAQFPPGSVGRVRRIGDPDIDGEEFIHVELTVNGMKDLLPFAPGDLAAPTKGASAAGTAPARANGVAPGAASGAAVGGASGSSHVAAPRSPLGPPPPTAAPATADRAGSADPVRTPDPGPVADPSGVASGPTPAPARPTPARAKAAPRSAAKRRGPAVAISIGTTEAEPPQWRIEAKVGSKVVLRHGSVPPARVWELVGALGDETLTRAVGSVLDEQRQAAQSRADALAAELAKVQAELAELPAPSDK